MTNINEIVLLELMQFGNLSHSPKEQAKQYLTQQKTNIGLNSPIANNLRGVREVATAEKRINNKAQIIANSTNKAANPNYHPIALRTPGIVFK